MSKIKQDNMSKRIKCDKEMDMTFQTRIDLPKMIELGKNKEYRHHFTDKVYKATLAVMQGIDKGTLNLDNYVGHVGRKWYGKDIWCEPIFASYGQIGYKVWSDKGLFADIEYDYEMGKIEVVIEF